MLLGLRDPKQVQASPIQISADEMGNFEKEICGDVKLSFYVYRLVFGLLAENGMFKTLLEYFKPIFDDQSCEPSLGAVAFPKRDYTFPLNLITFQVTTFAFRHLVVSATRQP